jgi:competence protein ComEC
LTLASLLVWMMAVPLVAYHFHVFSPVAVVLTPVLWGPVMLLLYCGFGVLVFSWPLPPAAWLCGWVCDAALWLLDMCVSVAREIPGSHFWVPAPPLWCLLGFYGWLIFPVVCPAWRPPRRWFVGVLAGCFLVGVGWPWLRGYLSDRRTDRLTGTFISVGHGTSVLLELPGGKNVLYDAGGLGSSRAAAESISAVLWSRGIRHLDAIVLSHADTDHYNAVPRLMGRFSIDAVYISPQMLAAHEETLGNHGVAHNGGTRPRDRLGTTLQCLREAAHSARVPIRCVFAGEQLPSGGPARLDVLHPPRHGSGESDNANSVVLLVELGGRRILLPGDLDGTGMEAVLQGEPVDCDVLMAPHHGRPTQKCRQLLRWSSPEWIVASGGVEKEPGQIDRQFAGYDGRLFHTATSGAVTVTIDGDDLFVHAFRSEIARTE